MLTRYEMTARPTLRSYLVQGNLKNGTINSILWALLKFDSAYQIWIWLDIEFLNNAAMFV